MSPQSERAALFHRLHVPGQPLLLLNVWDVASARVVAAQGAAALATSSSAVAESLGYADGEALPLVEVLWVVRRIAGAVELPLSVDFEAGYGGTPEQVAGSIRAVMQAGAVGVNLEDGLIEGRRELVEPAQHTRKIAAARAVAQLLGVPLFINARIDTFLLPVPDHLAETLRRAQTYIDAGANGIFVPGASRPQDIEQLARHIPAPLNVMAGPDFLGLAELAQLGVARVSVGPHLLGASLRQLGQTVGAVMQSGDFGQLRRSAGD